MYEMREFKQWNERGSPYVDWGLYETSHTVHQLSYIIENCSHQGREIFLLIWMSTHVLYNKMEFFILLTVINTLSFILSGSEGIQHPTSL